MTGNKTVRHSATIVVSIRNLALGRAERSATCPGRFTLMERASINPLVGGLKGCISNLDALEKSKYFSLLIFQ